MRSFQGRTMPALIRVLLPHRVLAVQQLNAWPCTPTLTRHIYICMTSRGSLESFLPDSIGITHATGFLMLPLGALVPVTVFIYSHFQLHTSH